MGGSGGGWVPPPDVLERLQRTLEDTHACPSYQPCWVLWYDEEISQTEQTFGGTEVIIWRSAARRWIVAGSHHQVAIAQKAYQRAYSKNSECEFGAFRARTRSTRSAYSEYREYLECVPGALGVRTRSIQSTRSTRNEYSEHSECVLGEFGVYLEYLEYSGCVLGALRAPARSTQGARSAYSE